MREFFHNMKLSFLLAAVLYIILGLILLIWPGVSATVFCYAFGGILLIYGVVTIVSFFLRDSRQGSFVFELFLGIVAAALGLLFLLRPVIVASVLPVILGLFIVVDGLVNLKRALELRRMLYLRWIVPLVLSAVSAVLGLVIVFQPFLAALLGFIPNCAASVLLTELYLGGALSFASVIAGLCTNAGIGLIVLFKVNGSKKECLKFVVLLYAAAVISGILLHLAGL